MPEVPKGRVLLLGATGVVGSEVRRQLAAHASHLDVVGVTRRGRDGTVALDVNDAAALAPLVRDASVVVNLVASTRWTMEQDEAIDANVGPLRTLLEVAPDDVRLIHLSTAYAGGVSDESGEISYRNTYEHSKACAERLLREERPTAQVLRFPLVIGRVSDGHIERYVGIYTILQALTGGLLPAVIGSPTTSVELIPVDVVASAVCRMVVGDLESPIGSIDRPYTLGAGMHAPTVDQFLNILLESLNSWRAARGVATLDKPRTIEPEAWHRFHRPFVWPHLGRVQRRAIELLEAFAPYLSTPLTAEPDECCSDVVDALGRSVEYWADSAPRLASRVPRPWVAGSDTKIGA